MAYYGALACGEDNNKDECDFDSDKFKEVEKSMPSHLGISVLSQSKRVNIIFVHKIDGSYSNKQFYQDSDSLYIHVDQ